MDAPTVRILERALGDFARMSREAREVRDALPGLSGGDAGLLARLQGDESAIGEIVAPEAAVEAAK